MTLKINYSTVQRKVIDDLRTRYNELISVIQASKIQIRQMGVANEFVVLHIDEDDKAIYITDDFFLERSSYSKSFNITSMLDCGMLGLDEINFWLNSKEGFNYHLKRFATSLLKEKFDMILSSVTEPDCNSYDLQDLYLLTEEVGLLVDDFLEVFKEKFKSFKSLYKEVRNIEHSSKLSQKYLKSLQEKFDTTNFKEFDRMYFFINSEGNIDFKRNVILGDPQSYLEPFEYNRSLYDDTFEYLLLKYKGDSDSDLEEKILSELTEIIHNHGIQPMDQEITSMIHGVDNIN